MYSKAIANLLSVTDHGTLPTRQASNNVFLAYGFGRRSGVFPRVISDFRISMNRVVWALVRLGRSLALPMLRGTGVTLPMPEVGGHRITAEYSLLSCRCDVPDGVLEEFFEALATGEPLPVNAQRPQRETTDVRAWRLDPFPYRRRQRHLACRPSLQSGPSRSPCRHGDRER